MYKSSPRVSLSQSHDYSRKAMEGESGKTFTESYQLEEKHLMTSTAVRQYVGEPRKQDEDHDADTQLLSYTTSPRPTWTQPNLEVNGRRVISLPDRHDAEADGVITAGIPSPSRKKADAAGVITGGDDGFRNRLVHTRFPWLDDCMLLVAGHRPLYFKKKEMKFEHTIRSSPDALAVAWSAFVDSMVKDEEGWMRGFTKVKSSFMDYDVDGDKIREHEQCVVEQVPCCVTMEQRRPMRDMDTPKTITVTCRSVTSTTYASFDIGGACAGEVTNATSSDSHTDEHAVFTSNEEPSGDDGDENQDTHQVTAELSDGEFPCSIGRLSYHKRGSFMER
ncbi:unnamed protein product [Phytophthora fragariaefolia]|uniref:Unnamed protein product n=1 Tax=Phytophthora fragariaefolia TaxID=1490495 RepID=A0A9W6YDE6_9STRA|nr:unnamed protein product [Phytophthora fragariaefolia]